MYPHRKHTPHVPNGVQVFYVGKHGNDGYPGTNWDKPFLTFTAAIAAATALIPASTNQFLIECQDAGIYTEEITVPAYVHVCAPAAEFRPATVTGSAVVVLQLASSLEAYTITAPVGAITVSATGNSYLTTSYISALTGGTGIHVANGAYLYATVKFINSLGLAYDVDAGGYLYLVCPSITGIRVDNGTTYLSYAEQSVLASGTLTDTAVPRLNTSVTVDNPTIEETEIRIDNVNDITWSTDGLGNIGKTDDLRPDIVNTTSGLNIGDGSLTLNSSAQISAAAGEVILRDIDLLMETDAAADLGYLHNNRFNQAFLASGINIGNNTLEAGTPPHATAIDTADVGVISRNTTNTLVLVSQRTSGSGNVSNAIVADVEAAAIDADHEILDTGWYDNTGTYHGSWVHKDASIEAASASTAQVFGTEADGAAAVGTEVGTTEDYVTAGAKLLKVINNETEERAYIDYQGALGLHKLDHGQEFMVDTMEDLVTIAAAASTDSTILIPSGCQVWSVSNRVVTTIPGADSMQVGVPGDTDRYGNGLGVTAGATHHGMGDGTRYYGASTAIRITPQPVPGAATGEVRLTVHYIKTTPATS